tara:strand:- start:171 stop:902 length:732 start_codon:yes stop_codon:yes gene_type:complete
LIITDKYLTGPLNQITIKGENIQIVKESKSLGVYIDNKLSWKKQASTISKSFNTKIKLLKRLDYLPLKVLEQIYYKTIIPSVVYCISVWRSCPPSTFDMIEAVHAKAAHLIYHLPKELDDYSSLERANWLPLNHIYNRRLLIIMKECKDGIKDERIRSLFKIKEHQRKGCLFEMIRPRKEIGRETVKFRGPVMWNKLSATIRNNNSSIDSFKKQLKKEKVLKNISFRKEAFLNTNMDTNFVYF